MRRFNQLSGPLAAAVRGRSGGIGRSSSKEAERVSNDLRLGAGELLHNRRMAAGLSLAAMGSLGVVAAYQFGLIKSVPEPAFKYLGASVVDASGEAYQMFRTPDSAIGLASQAVTLALIGAGTGNRSAERPWLPVLAAGKAVADAISAGYLTVEQVSRHRKLCSWCLGAAVANVAIIRYVAPEAWHLARSFAQR